MPIVRRRFLGGLTGAGFGLIAGTSLRAQSASNARLAIAYEDVGRPIPPDFLGLSYESAILADGNYFSPENASILGLIGGLGRSGVIRIGGNTSERTVWRVDAGPAAAGSFVITPASIDRLAAVLQTLQWKLIYGLNLARGTPEDAAEEAAYVARAAASNLLAFQIGNEPDGFGLWAGVRPKGYDAAAFLAEWRRFHEAVRARVPEARFAGPDVAAASDWIAAFAQARPDGLALLTCHYYAEGPAGSPDVTLARLLDANAQPTLDTLARDSRLYGLPFRIVEANSVYNEGEPGVSDTLGSALWGLEFLFQALAAGAAGVNFHAGVHNLRPSQDKAYTPIARSGGGRYQARPLYYAMRMFAQAARGVLLRSRLSSDNADLNAFAVRAIEGGLRVCLINKSMVQRVRLRIEPERDFATASILRLTGPSADATTGTAIGGSSIDALGRWAPAAEEMPRPGREVMVSLEPASAALLKLEV